MKITRKYITIFITGISIMACISTAYAEENYNTEFSFQYYSSDDDSSEIIVYGVNAEIYFSEVDTTGHPYAEAAFLERIGNVSLLVGKGEVEIGSTVEADGPIYGAMLTYMKPESPIAVQAIYGKRELEYDFPFDGDEDLDSYGLGLGYFISDGALVSIDYRHSETDLDIPIINLHETFEYDDYELGVKYVKEKPGGTAINLESGIEISQLDDGTDDKSNTIIEISGDYYVNRMTSIGGGLGINTGDDKDDEGITWVVNFKSFLNPGFSINTVFEKFLADNDEGEDEDSLSFVVSARF